MEELKASQAEALARKDEALKQRKGAIEKLKLQIGERNRELEVVFHEKAELSEQIEDLNQIVLIFPP